MQQYLSVCAIFKNEADYLQEWLEFHRIVGVERFFLYDNLSTDRSAEVLAPYVADSTVQLTRWSDVPGQRSAYDDCLRRQRGKSRWIAFIDIDEFLFSPTRQPLPEILEEFEPWPAVGAHWAVYGPSGHRRKPSGLVTESYMLRTAGPKGNWWMKSIVDPRRTERCITSHVFAYRSGFPVDENHRLINGPVMGRSGDVTFEKLRINHYWTKSEQEWRRKLGAPGPNTNTKDARPRPWRDEETLFASLSQEYDDAIATYLPALREAMTTRKGHAAVTTSRPRP